MKERLKYAKSPGGSRKNREENTEMAPGSVDQVVRDPVPLKEDLRSPQQTGRELWGE